MLSREIPNEDKRRCHFIGSWDCARGGGRGKGRESKPIQFSCFRFSTLFRRLRLLLRSMTVRQAACTFLHADSLAFLPLSTKVHVRTQDMSGGRHQPRSAMTSIRGWIMSQYLAPGYHGTMYVRACALCVRCCVRCAWTRQLINNNNSTHSLCKEQTTGTTPSPRPHQRTPNRIECCAKGGVYRLWSSLALRLPRHWPLCPLSPHNRLHHRWTPSSLNNMRHRRRCIWGGPSRGEGSRTLHPAP